MSSSKINISRNILSSPCGDQSDRKALKLLEDRLERVRSKSTLLSFSPKYKQLPISNYYASDSPMKEKVAEKCKPKYHHKNGTSSHVEKNKSKYHNKKGSRKKRGIDNNENHNDNNEKCLKTITTWFSKRPKATLSNQNVIDKKQTNTKNEGCERNKNSKRILKRSSSGSFDKYGVHVPSFEDIRENQKKYKMHEEFLERLGEMNCSQESLELDIDKPSTPKIVLDCKHLTKDDLIKAFEENRTYISNIINGIEYSSRHDRFYNENPAVEQFTNRDLKYNPCTLCYTYDQKEVLLDLLFKTFDKDSELGSNNQYFFKVLLPELCLRIFMEVHNMSCDEAYTYFEDRPVEELSF